MVVDVLRTAALLLLLMFSLPGCGGRAAIPRAPFWPARVRVAQDVRLLYRAAGAPGTPGLHRYEYVFPDRAIAVYDIDQGHRLVARWSVPEAHALRGIAVSPATCRLYFSVGGNGGSSGTGSLISYDLRTNRVLWKRSFPTGTDSLAITPDGRTLYLPTGERTDDDIWYVVAASTGRVRGEIHAGPGPHNTIVSPDGRFAYLGPRNSRYLDVAATRTDRVVRKVGPLLPGVRPFTINGRQTLAYTTATGFLGFQASSIRTGKVLYTVPIRGFRQGGHSARPAMEFRFRRIAGSST